MHISDRHAIEDLFGKLDQLERSNAGVARDPEAEAFIRERLTRQPGAPYYMAQTIVVQEQALLAAQERIESLEDALANRPSGGGGFLSGLFGGGPPQPAPQRAPMNSYPAHGSSGWIPSAAPGAAPGAFGGQARGGGFLAGAAQTAMGVAGGVVLGGLLANALGSGAEGEPATAQQAPAEPGDEGDAGFDSEAA